MKPPAICFVAVCHFGFSVLAWGQPAKSAEPAAHKAGDVVLEAASFDTKETGKVDFEFGTLYVPENRADPKSRLIGVGFARFKARKATGAPPTFHLPGGPGTSFLAFLKPDNKQLGARLKQIERYRQVGDVVLVDQRGFSERGEVLKYKHRTPDEPLDQPGSLARATEAFKEMARAAVADYAKKGADLRGYTVKECADDVNDLRQALGYERLTLVGTSFGSQWSFAIMRRHPDKVARALLSGVEPLDYGYDMPSHVLAAVQRLWWEAERDPRLKPYLPPGGLMQAARDVLRRLEREPLRVGVKDPKSGDKTTIVLGREDFQRDAFFKAADGPAFLLSLYHGHYDAWAASVLANRRARDVEQRMIGPLIDVGLGVTPKRKFFLRNDPASDFLGHWNFDSYLATVGIWPTADVGDDFRTEIICRIPVVFAQGDWDTSTPVENTLDIAPNFPNSRVLIAEHGSHGVLGPIAQSLPDVNAKLLEFLETGGTTNLPARVKLPTPKFAVPDFPPPAP
jgi:pimeloyl-ACP methyl ester carboxylesterase